MKLTAASFKIPPHANQAAHDRLMKRLKAMTQDERRQSLIDAGILTKTGKLAKKYAPSKPPAAKPTPTR